MRLFEFTNAQEQLALLRVIIDNTWQAIEQQAAQQARAAAERAAAKPVRKPASTSVKPLPVTKLPAAKPKVDKSAVKPIVVKPNTAPIQPKAPVKPISTVKLPTSAQAGVNTAQMGSTA